LVQEVKVEPVDEEMEIICISSDEDGLEVENGDENKENRAPN
jgi:hypothetical protein